MDEVLVSVIMMCYNHESYIRKAIESVLSQKTNFRYEVIIHDDASTDHSAEIIKEYQRKYPEKIIAIIQKENLYSRRISARKVYIDPIIKGKYIATCECDDYWIDENKLQKQVDFLEDHAEYAGCCHNCRLVNDQNQEFAYNYGVYKKCREHRYTLSDLAAGKYFPGQTASLLYNRKAYDMHSEQEEQAFYAIRTRSGDLRRNMLLLLKGDIFYMQDIMSAHRVVKNKGDSWSARRQGKNDCFEKMVRSVDMRKFARRYYHRFYWNYYSTLRAIGKAVKLRLTRPTQENRKAFRDICREKRNVVFLLAYMGMLSIASVPSLFQIVIENFRFIPESALQKEQRK